MLLCYITDSQGRKRRIEWLLDRIARMARAGVDLIQIREKDLSGRALYDLCLAAFREVRTARTGCRLLVNDRLDVAVAAGIDGVHLPAAGLPAGRIREITQPGFLVGRSCHSQQEVSAVAAQGADFAVLGPIFPTPSKAGQGEPLGRGSLSIAYRVKIPVLALGGVSLANAAECMDAGAGGVAGIRMFQDQPEQAVAALRKVVDNRQQS